MLIYGLLNETVKELVQLKHIQTNNTIKYFKVKTFKRKTGFVINKNESFTFFFYIYILIMGCSQIINHLNIKIVRVIDKDYIHSLNQISNKLKNVSVKLIYDQNSKSVQSILKKFIYIVYS